MSHLLHSSLTAMMQRRVIAAIKQSKPDLIITTHALLTYELTHVREWASVKVPLVFQLTDLEEVHTTWFAERRADAYLAPSREICEQVVKRGIDSYRVHTTGRPIRSQFMKAASVNRNEVLTSLGLDSHRFTLFLQGGAKGSAEIDRAVHNMLEAEEPVQIILAVGNNMSLKARFDNVEHVYALPFTADIAPYMAASDIIVGKAGASFVSEAFMLEKPFLVTTYIPGQEAPTLRFMERHNLGWVCLEPAAQQRLIVALASNPAMMAEKVASIRAYKAWNMQANQELYPVIAGLLSRSTT